MFTIPNIPTDNLYKFIALSGIAILMFSIYLYVNKGYEIKNSLRETEMKLAILEVKTEIISWDSTIYEHYKKLASDSLVSNKE